jgi:ankyrin repeat protein
MDCMTEEERISMGRRLIDACENNNFETVVASIKEGADPSFCDVVRCKLASPIVKVTPTPLIIHYLLSYYKDNYQVTPLAKAAEKGYDKIIEVLLKAGAEVECKKHVSRCNVGTDR